MSPVGAGEGAAQDLTQHAAAKLVRGGRSLDLDLDGVPLARVRLDTALLAEEHQALVRRLVACWSLHLGTPLAELEAQAQPGAVGGLFGEGP